MARRKEGRKDSTNDGTKEGRKDSTNDGTKEGRKAGRNDGTKEGRNGGRKEGTTVLTRTQTLLSAGVVDRLATNDERCRHRREATVGWRVAH